MGRDLGSDMFQLSLTHQQGLCFRLAENAFRRKSEEETLFIMNALNEGMGEMNIGTIGQLDVGAIGPLANGYFPQVSINVFG